MRRPTIGIVGGTGKMGQLFKNFFQKKDFKVLISSRRTTLTNIELAERSDVIIISVPLSVVVKVIKEIAPFVRKDALLTDISAVKEEPVKAMLKSKASVVGMHPVFGPMTKSFKNQTIVLCPARGRKWFLWLKNLFKKEGFNVKISTPKEHDKMMAVIQGLTHFTAISSGYTLKKLKVDLEKSLEFMSPNYRLSMDVVGRILAQEPEVYTDIELYNKYVKNVIYNYQKSSKEIFEAIKNKNKKKHEKIFKDSSKHLAEYRFKALEETNFLLEKLIKEK